MTLRRIAAPLLASAALLAGCATTPGRAPTNPQADPWEGFNRGVFAFNDAVDAAVLKPLATAYRDLLPSPLRTGIANVFGNVEDLWSAINHVLQGKLQSGLDMGMRVAVNSSFGLFGLLDPATELQLERRSEDFGQTLAVWGAGPGPYLVLPFLGPSTVRDTLAKPLDMTPSPSLMTDREALRNGFRVLGIVDTRARLLATTDLLGQAALDRYSFARDAYLARRLDQIHDGAPPLDDPDADAAAPATAPAAAASAPRR